MRSARPHWVMAFLWLVLSVALSPSVCLAQNKKELEETRKKILKDIETTQRMIQKTAANRESEYDRFVAIQSQLESRGSLIQTIEAEILASDETVTRNKSVIGSLTKDIDRMQAEYGRTIRSAFRRKTLSNPLLYILSAESLNQAFRRWLYLRKYDEFRRKQALAIIATRNMLAKKNRSIEDARVEKENLLVSIQGQRVSMSTELGDQNILLQSLTKDEGRLKADLQKKQATYESLNAAIEKIIQTEVNKRVDEARKAKATAPKPPTTPPPTPKPEKKPEIVAENPPIKQVPPPVKQNPIPEPIKDEPAIAAETPDALPATPVASEDLESMDFSRNRGRLPWPVTNGFVSRGFGKQKHPTIKNIEITNNGIDIRTEEGAEVKAVYSGKVAGVQFIPGHDYTVIIQHGDFYTVYSNLKSTALAKGDTVKGKQVIGEVSTNTITGTSELHFELWNQKERMNPAAWIKKGQ